MDQEQQIAKLAQHGLQVTRHVQTQVSNVTTAWQVKWSDEMVARDLLQNFFDANREAIDRIETSVDQQTATIAAPASFDLWRLYFLGSEKDLESVGQYGEGFKAAAVSFLRLPNRVILAGSEGSAVVIHPSETPVEGTTTLFPLIYDFYEIQPIEGTKLILEGCSSPLASSLQNALSNFFYPANPLLGPVIWESKKLAIYRSNGKDGALFYRSLLRGHLADIPIVFVIKIASAEVEKKIGADRDRKEFDSSIRDFFLNFICSRYLERSSDLVSRLVEEMQPLWRSGKGNALLEHLSRIVWLNTTHGRFSKFLPPHEYYAKSTEPASYEAKIQYQTVIKQWTEAKLVALPNYFARFGVQTVESYLKAIEQKAIQEAVKKGHRSPTPLEWEAIRLLRECLKAIGPEVASVFEQSNSNYSIGATDVILGRLKSSRSYRSKEVYFSEAIFKMPFSGALALFVHEHTHCFGYDGSRGFSDALTLILENTISQRRKFNAFEQRWLEMITKIAKQAEQRDLSPIARLLKEKPLKEIERWLLTLPTDLIEKLSEPSVETDCESDDF